MFKVFQKILDFSKLLESSLSVAGTSEQNRGQKGEQNQFEQRQEDHLLTFQPHWGR